jgi:hypothetical protein
MPSNPQSCLKINKNVPTNEVEEETKILRPRRSSFIRQEIEEFEL